MVDDLLLPPEFDSAFRLIAGESLHERERRRLLVRGAHLLLSTAMKPAAVAAFLGYSSAEGFQSDFKQFFGLTPRSYRERGRLVRTPKCHDIANLYQPNLERWPALNLASCRHLGNFFDIGPAIDQLYAWAATRGIFPLRLRGLYLLHDDPFLVPPALQSADAALVLQSEALADGEVNVFTMAPQRYISVVHQGPYSELDLPLFWLTRFWLPLSNERPAPGCFVVEFLNHPSECPPENWRFKISIPVA